MSSDVGVRDVDGAEEMSSDERSLRCGRRGDEQCDERATSDEIGGWTQRQETGPS